MVTNLSSMEAGAVLLRRTSEFPQAWKTRRRWVKDCDIRDLRTGLRKLWITAKGDTKAYEVPTGWLRTE